jgi:hypothetical protein
MPGYSFSTDNLNSTPCQVVTLAATGQAQAKLDYLERTGAGQTVVVGNGRNPRGTGGNLRPRQATPYGRAPEQPEQFFELTFNDQKPLFETF